MPRWREVATFLPNLVLLFRGLANDPHVSRRAKIALAIGAVWLASPIDLIPEFVPIAGPLDDAIIAGLILRYVLRSTERSLLDAHWRGDPRTPGRFLAPGRHLFSGLGRHGRSGAAGWILHAARGQTPSCVRERG